MKETLRDALSELPEFVYVADIDTYELLYMNEAALVAYGDGTEESVMGRKCYDAIQGLDEPCSFCTNHLLNHKHFYSWEFTNRKTERHYVLRDKLIDWGGREARVEIAFDLSDREREEASLRYLVAMSETIMDCVGMLDDEHDLPATTDRVLERLGTFLGAARTYVIEIDGDLMSNTHEWCAEGVTPQMEFLQAQPIELIDRWRESFAKHRAMIVDDAKAIEGESPDEFAVLQVQEIERLVAAPLEIDGKLIGTIGVDDPDVDDLTHIAAPLMTLAYFIAASIRRKDAREKLEHASYTDLLTGAMNRNAFARDTEHAACWTDVGVAYLDVNGLKETNDLDGHRAGDMVLQYTANALIDVFGSDCVYRVGGDEFVVICGNMAFDAFTSKTLAVKRKLAGECCSASVGYHWEERCDDIQRALHLADEQMFDEKREHYEHKPSSHRYRHRMDDVLELADPDVLKSSIERGDFVLYLQPKMDAETRAVVSAESLVRMQRSRGELVAPDRFIPLLEARGLMHHLDFFMFEEACRLLRIWIDASVEPLPISVNFSRRSFEREDFFEQLCSIVASWDVPARLVTIEVTESIEASDARLFFALVDKLRGYGFCVSVDDFGVRYANMSLLSTLSFDELKLDRTLIADVVDNQKTRVMLKAIIDVCRAFGILTVAEGVETEEQFEALRSIGCEMAQGYLFDRPLPVSEFEERYLLSAR